MLDNVTEQVTELALRIEEFRKANTVRTRCKWPSELKIMLYAANKNGVAMSRLSSLCGVHRDTIRKWIGEEDTSTIKLQELKVVEKKTPESIVTNTLTVLIKLPNGISLELPFNALTTSIIHTLGSELVRQ